MAAAATLAVLGVGQSTASLNLRIEFYEAAAQIMPVLILVAAVEGRYFREQSDDDPTDRFIVRVLWFGGLIGLGTALWVVAEGHDTLILRGIVFCSLILLGMLVSVFALIGPAKSEG